MRGAWLFIVRSSCAKGRGEKASQLQLKCRSSMIDEKSHPKAPKPGSYHRRIGKSVPGRGSGKCKVCNLAEDPSNLPHRARP